jgi:hypothetical protein
MILLLKCVQQKGGHVATKKTVTGIWDSILVMFFNDPAAAIYNRDPLNKTSRKLRDKYDDMMDKTKKEMGWGDFYGGRTANLSGKSDEQSEIHQLVKQIEMEIEDHDAELEEKKNEKNKLENITTTILDPLNPNPKNKKPRNGKVDKTLGEEDETKTPKSNSSSFDLALLKFMEGGGTNFF